MEGLKMAKGIVIYYSRSGNTKQMAELIAKAMNDGGLATDCKGIDKVKVDDLLGYDAVVVGSPTYYGTMAAQIKQLFDDSVVKHGQLDGKVGAAFTSSANVAGGNETTILSILEAMLISGMVIQGDPQGDHYGPVSIGKPDHRAEQLCKRWGKRIAGLTNKLTA